MRRPAICLVSSAVLVCVAITRVSAQSANPYVGTWHANFIGAIGQAKEAKLTLTEDGGEWKFYSRELRKQQPCEWSPSPVELKRVSEDELVFIIMGSRALPGCQDIRVRVRRADERTLQGQLGRNSITLVRE